MLPTSGGLGCTRAGGSALSREMENHRHIVIAMAPRPGFRNVVGIVKVNDHAVLMANRGIGKVARAGELKIEPSFIAPRATIDAIAADRAQAEQLLVPWQRQLMGL